MDIQYVIDPYACCAYIASYIMKSQRGMSRLLQQAVSETKSGNFTHRDKLRIISNQFLNHCEVSAQEAIYLLLEMPLTSSSRDVIFVNTSPPDKRVAILKSKEQLAAFPGDATDVTCPGLLGRYGDRSEELEKMCLADFATLLDKRSKPCTKKKPKEDEDIDNIDNHVKEVQAGKQYTMPNGDVLVARKTRKVLRHVRYNIKEDQDNYYREQLLLFLPWRQEISEESEELYKVNEKEIIANRTNYITDSDTVLDEAMNVDEEAMLDTMDTIAPQAQQEDDDALQVHMDTEDFPSLQPEEQYHATYDIGIEIGCPQNVLHIPIHNRIPDEQYHAIVQSFNRQQKEFFNHVLHTLKLNLPHIICSLVVEQVSENHMLSKVLTKPC